ncbi:hypothetical protein [Nostoc sp.]|uniref:hypothetical protein n=1 Tax=Nostoc sp. TaxID=1180 RepID=UPI002FF82BD7
MAVNLIASLSAEADQLTLKQAYSALEGDEQADIPFLVWLLENPGSFLALPGKINLRNHDYVHILLGREQSAQDEAFILGFTMGNDLKTKWFHLAIFKFFAQFLYPKAYQFCRNDLEAFDLGFAYGRRLKVKQLNEFNFAAYENEPISSIRQRLGIDVDEIKLLRQFEFWLIPDASTSQKLFN